MAEPLFPFDMYTRLINAYSTYNFFEVSCKFPRNFWRRTESGGDTLRSISIVVDDLPAINKSLLKTLLEVTSYIERNASVNQMTSSNLSIVFAPNIVRAPQETVQQAIMDSPIINSIVRLLIENPNAILHQ